MSRHSIMLLCTYSILLIVLYNAQFTQSESSRPRNRVEEQNSFARYNTRRYPGSRHSYPSSGMGLTYRGRQIYAIPGLPWVRNSNYIYSPPQQIHYASPHGAPVSYPVYRETPPMYVYQYKESGSKYRTLLVGLALLNLGALTGGTINYGTVHNSSSNNNNYQDYKARPGEVCIFRIKKDNGGYEETGIHCHLISCFIYEAEQQQQLQNQTSVTTTITNTTVVNTTHAQDTPTYALSPNSTLVTPEVTLVTAPVSGETVTSITNPTVVNAIDVKGPPILVTPGMLCYVIKTSPSARMEKDVPCTLLQMYADQSLISKSAAATVTTSDVA